MNRSDLSSPLRLVLAGDDEHAADLLRDLLSPSPPPAWEVVLVLADRPDAPVLAVAAEHDLPYRQPIDRAAAAAVADTAADLVCDLRPGGTPSLPGATPLAPRLVEALAVAARRCQAAATAAAVTQQRLERFMDFAPFGIYMKDTNLRYRSVNPAACRLLRLPAERILGRTDDELLSPAAARRLQEWEQRALAAGEPVTLDGVLPLDENDRLYLRVTLLPVVHDGRAIALFGLVEDTTDLHTSERRLSRQRAELTEMREYLRGILANSQDMIVLTTLDGTIVSFNDGAEAISGFSRDEVLGQRFQFLAAEPEVLTRLLEEARQEGHAGCEEMRFRHRSGHEFIANVSLTTINSPSGHPIEIVSICRDLTRRLQLQEDLIQSERLAAIGKLAAGVAHEINNPLQIIETVAGLIEDLVGEAGDSIPPALRERIRDGIRRLYQQTERCMTITHSLLGFARRSSGRPAPVSVPDLVEDAVTLLAPEIRRLGIEVQRRFSARLPAVVVDPTLLEQVLVNLLKNAVDAIEERQPRQPRLELLASLVESPEGMRLAVTVRDNGIGIPPDRLSQIFELFYTSKPAGKGTGLGLSIVRHIVQKLGGEVRVESHPDEGSAFTIILPLVTDETEEGILLPRA